MAMLVLLEGVDLDVAPLPSLIPPDERSRTVPTIPRKLVKHVSHGYTTRLQVVVREHLHSNPRWTLL